MPYHRDELPIAARSPGPDAAEGRPSTNKVSLRVRWEEHVAPTCSLRDVGRSVTDRTAQLRNAWREIRYADLRNQLAETEKQLAAVDERTILLGALRRAEAEVERIRSLLESTGTGTSSSGRA